MTRMIFQNQNFQICKTQKNVERKRGFWYGTPITKTVVLLFKNITTLVDPVSDLIFDCSFFSDTTEVMLRWEKVFFCSMEKVCKIKFLGSSPLQSLQFDQCEMDESVSVFWNGFQISLNLCKFVPFLSEMVASTAYPTTLTLRNSMYMKELKLLGGKEIIRSSSSSSTSSSSSSTSSSKSGESNEILRPLTTWIWNSQLSEINISGNLVFVIHDSASFLPKRFVMDSGGRVLDAQTIFLSSK